MNESSAAERQKPEISATGPGMEASVWLLQKDETRFLYLSLSLSVIVHFILFVIMAATRIFHPFAGASQEFDLVWFSSAATTTPKETSTPDPATAQHEDINRPKTSTARVARTAPVTQEKINSKAPSTDISEAPPPDNPPQDSPVTAMVQTVKETSTEEPAEMVITRFRGKVVEVVDKMAENPTFRITSSVKMKNTKTQSGVKTTKETVAAQNIKQEASLSAVQSKEKIPGARAEKELSGKPSTQSRAVTASAYQPEMILGADTKNAVLRKVSSASISAVGRKTGILPTVNRSINSYAAALGSLSATGNRTAGEEQISQNQGHGINSAEQPFPLQKPAEPKAPTRPSSVEKKAPAEVPESQPLPPPRSILHPPVAGDLKLIITGDINVKVEIYFKPFPKNRRNKPFTRREAENRRSIIPKLVRTRESEHEAVVEIAEEGIYSIMVRGDDGKPGTAGLVLKIRESGPGTKSKDLGLRKIDKPVEVAKVLMPEGVLWTDDKDFTGDMEDADSITKFNSGTGLMWREYK